MFRLIKLALYVTLGWMIYEIYQGMSAGSASGSLGGGGERSSSFGDDATRTNLTGAGEGAEVQSSDAGGTSMRHTVGRGVVSL